MGDTLRVNRNISLSTEERNMMRTLGQGAGQQTVSADGMGDFKTWRETAGELVEKGLAEEPLPGGFRLTPRGRRILRTVQG